MVTYRAFDEVIDFIASGPSPEEIIAFKPSASMQNRVDELLEKKRESGLSEAEAREVEQFLMVEHIMRPAKARARQRLTTKDLHAPYVENPAFDFLTSEEEDIYTDSDLKVKY